MSKDTETKKAQQIQKTAPAHNLTQFEDMEKMFDDFFTRGWLKPWRFEWPSFSEMKWPVNGRFPNVDVIDRDDEIVVKAELPGVEKKDLEVTTTDDSVTIKGSTQREKNEEKGDYYRSEISRGEFSRTIALPATVDTGKAKASFKDGMLELVLPKTEIRKRRNISID
jgi:HSP20 family protein